MYTSQEETVLSRQISTSAEYSTKRGQAHRPLERCACPLFVLYSKTHQQGETDSSVSVLLFAHVGLTDHPNLRIMWLVQVQETVCARRKKDARMVRVCLNQDRLRTNPHRPRDSKRL